MAARQRTDGTAGRGAENPAINARLQVSRRMPAINNDAAELNVIMLTTGGRR